MWFCNSFILIGIIFYFYCVVLKITYVVSKHCQVDLELIYNPVVLKLHMEIKGISSTSVKMNCDIYQSKVKQNGANFDTSPASLPSLRARVNCTIKDATIKDTTKKDAAIKDVTIKGAITKDATIKDATIKDATIKIGALMNQMNSRRADDNYDNNNPAAGPEEDAECLPLHIALRCDGNLCWTWWGHVKVEGGGDLSAARSMIGYVTGANHVVGRICSLLSIQEGHSHHHHKWQ
jgi:hypothetical protein